MSWRININKNTVKVTRECALEIAKSNTEIGSACAMETSCMLAEDFEPIWTEECEEEALEYLLSDGDTLYFDYDHMEHMDYVWQVQDILCKYKVKGDIAFSSNEGDDKGDAWCYRFDGNGNCEVLKKPIDGLWD